MSVSDFSDPDTGEVAHRHLANAIRALAMDAVETAKSGHPGLPMGLADVATVLFTAEQPIKIDPLDPAWPDRDRLILSAGHGSMLIYALLHLIGVVGMPMEEIRKFRQWGSRTPGHPEHEPELGIEMTTGPLGQGIATAVGMAIAERSMAARFGGDLVDHFTFVLASDGDLMEGISHEAASFAGHLGLGRLIVLYDDNRISIDGATDLSLSDDAMMRFEAYGWHVSAVDGHDELAIEAAIDAAREEVVRPSLICCRTTIGYGAPNKAGSASAHGAPLGAEEIAATREVLDWPYPAFEVPEPVLARWRSVGARSRAAHDAWTDRLASSPHRQEFERVQAGMLPAPASEILSAIKAEFVESRPKLATRQSSGKVLEHLVPSVAEVIGGSADLSGSNNTQVKNVPVMAPGRFDGRYIHYGVREHAMAAAMNGMALHRGVIPYSGTFLVFSDYCRPAIRLGALMGQRVIHVMTHDSIGLGEDGPTHQPVEHLAALRAIPNVLVLRPADAVETAECWEIAIERCAGPSILALTRQGLPALRDDVSENLSGRGGYTVRDCDGAPAVVLVGTGSEVSIAVEAQGLLAEAGVAARVVSMPCRELFEAEDAAYRATVIPPGLPVVVVEAAVRQGWEPILGPTGRFVGMTGFGASAPYGDLYREFGITAEKVAEAARAQL